MPGTLFVVATPIGNLEDVTLRALRVLGSAGLVAAEDTRRTGKLLAHHGIATRTLSFHDHNHRERIPQLLERLRDGTDIALVTDAGTPGVSDPGAELVQACVAEGIAVEPVPGVSAPLTAAVASGFPLVPLTVFGFAPSRSKDRSAWFDDIKCVQHTFTFFETPHRIAASLGDMADCFGERQIMVARELTKLHQQFLRGTARDVMAQLENPRGEFTIVVGPSDRSEQMVVPASDEEVLAEFGRMGDSGAGSRRQTLAAVASRCGRSVRDVYATIERSKRQ